MPEEKKKILIVEDDKIQREALAEEFLDQGFTVVKAKDGSEGLEKTLKGHPDLILLDLAMPKKDGISFLKDLRKDKWGKNANVVVLTNYKAVEKTADVLDAGAHDYIVKSLSLEDVTRIIKQKLGID